MDNVLNVNVRKYPRKNAVMYWNRRQIAYSMWLTAIVTIKGPNVFNVTIFSKIIIKSKILFCDKHFWVIIYFGRYLRDQ